MLIKINYYFINYIKIKMTDEVTSPLLYKNENLGEIENEEKEENQKNNIKKDISKKPDIRHNEEIPLLNNRTENQKSLFERIKDLFDVYIRVTRRIGLIFLSYAFQMFIFYLLLYYSFDKFKLRHLYLNLFFTLSITILAIITFVYMEKFNELKNLPFLHLIFLAIISTISTYFFIYRIAIIITYELMRNLIFTFISFFLSLFFTYFFGSGSSGEVGDKAFKFSILIISIFCLGLFLFDIVKISISFIIWIISIVFLTISQVHMDKYYKGYIRYIEINEYPIIYMCLHINLFILACCYAFIFTEVIIQLLIQYIKDSFK